MRRAVTAAVALLVGAYVGWKTDDWLEKLGRQFEADAARDRHLQADAIVTEVEARWGPPSQWAGAFHTHLPSFEPVAEDRAHP